MRPIARRLLELLPVGVLLPLGIGAASVNPHDAVSNISKWAEFLGISDLPGWAIRKSADRLIIELCVAISVAYLIFIFRKPLARLALRGETTRDISVPLIGQSASAIASETFTPHVDWLASLGEKDDEEINLRLYFCNRDTAYRCKLQAVDPYIDIEYWFINASVFPLKLDRIDGRLQYLHSDLQSKPEIIPPATVPPTPLVIRHGQAAKFVVRQWLTKETSARILAALDGKTADSIASIPGLTSGQVSMTFTYTNVSGATKEVRKAL